MTREARSTYNLDFIIDYCQKHNEVEWLKACANEPVAPNKNGKERTKSFVELQGEFIAKFFPEEAPKKKKPTMIVRINSL